ncbi:GTPase family protein [Citrobacter amalonaticus]|uniref:GTPase family protein n=1 Tax=Citrobacter amalonaticus TaxID=35703 RepID=UPI00215F7F2F|nr:GTPase [Citrobacter amalonaticus]
MSDRILTGQIPEALQQPLSRLPGILSDALVERLLCCVHYEPVIGVMGKSGAGKSSLCNTLFSPPPASVDPVRGCTRHVHRYQVTRGSRTLHIADFPGIAETPALDRRYRRLYRAWSSRLDLIVWALKADDRAWKDDLRCYRELLSVGAAPERFVFVLTQADKMEPCREWDNANHQPSPRQSENLRAKTELATTLFATVHPVVAVSATEHYNLELWAEALIKALPVSSCSAVSRHLHPELRTEGVQETAREGFVSVAGAIFDEAASVVQTTGRLVYQLQRLRRRFLAVIHAVWHLLF